METFGELALLAVSTVVGGVVVGAIAGGGVVVGFWHAVAPTAAENLPASQSMQAVAPEFGEYFPAEQGVQVPPTGPAFPAVQY
jgi:hypothetical protein